MIRYQELRVSPSVFFLLALSGAAWGANVWDEVPSDALGMIVVRDAAQTDAKAGQLLRDLQIPLPRPSALQRRRSPMRNPREVRRGERSSSAGQRPR